jgi:hypothetical protein
MRFLFLLFFLPSYFSKNFFLRKSAHGTVYVSDEVKNEAIISMRSAHVHSKNQLQSCFDHRANLTQYSITKLNNLVGHCTHTEVGIPIYSNIQPVICICFRTVGQTLTVKVLNTEIMKRAYGSSNAPRSE